MDEVFSISLQEMALEGPEGCSITTLWSVLQEPLQAAGFSLDPPLQGFIWQQLLHTPKICFFTTSPLQNATLSTAGEAPEHEPQEPHPPIASAQGTPKRYFLPKAHAEVQLWQTAAGVGVHVQAAKTLRDSALGLYEIAVSGSQLSLVQYDTLVKIGRARSRGALQSDLARTFGIAPTNYHYQVRQLETRGLISHRHVILPGSVGVSALNTNLLHLTRFGRSADLRARTHVRTAPKRGQKLRPKGGGGTNEPPSRNECDFIDLTQQMEEICEVLGAARGGVLVEAELRTSLEYTNAKEWRSLVRRLEGEGLVRLFRADINGSVKACIQLTEEAPQPQAESDALEEENPDGMILDVPVDGQIFDCIHEAGAEGLLSTVLWNKLRLNVKSNASWLSALIESGHVIQQAETLKKAVVYRLWTARNFPGGSQKQAQQPPKEADGRGSADEQKASGTSKEAKAEEDSPESGPVENASSEGQVVVYEGNGAIVPSQGPPKSSFLARFRRTSKVRTSDAVRRKELILNKLQKDGYILRSTLGRWIGTATGRDNPADAKLINRTLTDLHDEKRVRGLLVPVSSGREASKSRQVEVIVLADFVPDTSFADFIAKRVRNDARTSRQDGMRAQRERAERMDVRKVADVTRLGRKESRQKAEAMLDSMNAMRRNGYLYSKVLRARALHLYMWQHVIRTPEDEAKEDERDGQAKQDGSRTASKTSAEDMLRSIREAQAASSKGDDVSRTSAERSLSGDRGSGHIATGDAVEKADGWYDVAQLVREMPVQLYVQIVGSELPLERVSELTHNGARVKDCSPEELESEVLGFQAMARLTIIIELMQRLELLTPNSRPSNGDGEEAPSSSRKTLADLHKLTGTLRFEEPAGNGPVVHTFSIHKESDVLRYWAQLEATFSGRPKEDVRKVFPGSVASEVVGRVWATRRELSPTQRIELERRLPEDKELAAADLEAIANETGVASEQVHKLYYKRTRKARLRKLLSLGLTQSEVLRVLRKRKAADETKEKPAGLPAKAAKREPIQTELVESARARARRTLTTEASHVRAFKRKQAEGIPEPLESLAYKVRRIPASGGSPYATWASENMCMPKSGLADDSTHEHDVTKRGTGNAPVMEERLGADGKLVAPQRARKRRMRARALVRAEEESGEDDVAGALPGEPRAVRDRRKDSKPFARRSKRFNWTGEDTKRLIAAYAKWHAIYGKRRPTEWETVQDLPAPISNCKRHMTKLRRDKATLEAIAYAVVLACQRRTNALKEGVKPPSETGPPEEMVVQELSLMLKDEKDKEDAKQKGKGSSAEHEAMERISTQETPAGSSSFAWDDESDPIFSHALEAVAVAYEKAKGQLPTSETPVEKGNESEEILEGPHLFKGDHVQEIEERLGDNPGVATAFNLVQIGLLHARPNGAISDTVARALKKCGEEHVAQAMRYLQAHKFVVRGKPTHPFRMAERFQQRLSSSPFPARIGKSAQEFHSAVYADAGSSNTWAPVPPTPSEGQLAAILAMATDGTVELEPFEAGSAPWGRRRQENEPPETILQERGAPEWELGVRTRMPDGIEALSQGLGAGLSASTHAAVVQRRDVMGGQNDNHLKALGAESLGRRDAGQEVPSEWVDQSLPPTVPRKAQSEVNQSGEQERGGTQEAGKMRAREDDRAIGKHHLEREAGRASESKTDTGSFFLERVADPASNQSMTEGDASGIPQEADADAFELCCAAWCQHGVSGGPALERGLLQSVLENVRKAGGEGLTLGDVSKLLETDSHPARHSRRALAAQYVDALEAFDLVTTVNAVESVRVMAASSAERFLLPVHYTPPTNPELPRGTLPGSIKLQQGLRIQPWSTPRGGINRAYWALLKRRVISVVMINPGIPEKLLVRQLEVLTPQSCSDFLESLVIDGTLSVRTVAESPELGRSDGRTRNESVKHYFASAAAIFSL